MANTKKTIPIQLARLLSGFALLFALSGCGQKGDLYLPKSNYANFSIVQIDSLNT